ncbi:nucleoside-diphosphate-sugar epimerase [Nocardia transvalensis]|uniref:Nucleoside-diphosphate-sugar epimerase n=1 Tax=Nocardia transvalensis TaxID=37333 RepID=A0A7W9PIY0_9NOCA|nr:aldehyde reductase [Nocardia transvalensis]MBB5916940.1 nucleoside-diphosphate-sugar epimerase [Nocardia transvalensis]
MQDRVLVTGASGYLAGHIVAELRAHGYAVRGTARRATPEIAAQLGDIELVGADLSAGAGWAEAVAGCRYVIHAASPFPDAEPENEDDLVRPAVDGIRRVLRAAAEAGTVERVVVTSSIAAVRVGHADRVCTEEDWSDLAQCQAYEKSKTLAERAAWEFVRETAAFELAVVNPGMILGPVLRAEARTSVDAIRLLLAASMPGVPPIGFATVDVRDVAAAHRLAMTEPAAAGERYICAGDQVSLPQIARILADHYRVPTRTIPAPLIRLIARFNPAARTAARYLSRHEDVSSDKARRELGWTMRPIEQTVLDTAASLIHFGLVPDPGPNTRRAARKGVRPQSASASA